MSLLVFLSCSLGLKISPWYTCTIPIIFMRVTSASRRLCPWKLLEGIWTAFQWRLMITEKKKILVCQLEVNSKGYNRRKPVRILHKRGVFEEFMLELKLWWITCIMLLTGRCQSLWITTEKIMRVTISECQSTPTVLFVQENSKQMHFFGLNSFAKTDLERKLS